MMNHLKREYIIPAVVFVVVLIVGGGGFYLYSQSKPQVQGASVDNSQAAAQAELKKVVAEVGKLIDLPTGEDPTVATVTDITKLKDQPFFQKAKNGDKVLIYAQAKKAILYDPKAKKVIDIVPLNIGTGSAQLASPSASPKKDSI